jgi:hypothetical protein
MCAGIATCGNRIYASELDEHRLQVFRLDGSFVRMLGKGSLDCPSRIAATEERVFVACLREGVALSQAGELLFRFYPYHDMPPSLGLAKDELLVVVPNRLCVYDARDGTLLRSGHVAVHAGVILLSGTATVCPCLGPDISRSLFFLSPPLPRLGAALCWLRCAPPAVRPGGRCPPNEPLPNTISTAVNHNTAPSSLSRVEGTNFMDLFSATQRVEFRRSRTHVLSSRHEVSDRPSNEPSGETDPRGQCMDS